MKPPATDILRTAITTPITIFLQWKKGSKEEVKKVLQDVMVSVDLI